MHIEIQVALNFVISYLYNKLPRRRVNLFGEELEKALKQKFVGHWYPEKPFKVRSRGQTVFFYIIKYNDVNLRGFITYYFLLLYRKWCHL